MMYKSMCLRVFTSWGLQRRWALAEVPFELAGDGLIIQF
jgi:hypothetical protein